MYTDPIYMKNYKWALNRENEKIFLINDYNSNRSYLVLLVELSSVDRHHTDLMESVVEDYDHLN